jgi:hypothetical protein
MNKNIKIYEQYGKFSFSINKFSSTNHSYLTKNVRQYYKFAWEAQRDAKELASKNSYHLRVLEKSAMEDLHKPVVDDVAAERRLADHYEDIYDGLVDIASGAYENDKNEKKVNYYEAKAVVQEILYIIEKVPEDKMADEEEQSSSIARLEKIISKIRVLVKEHYYAELKEDQKKSREEKEEMEAGMGAEMGADVPEMGAEMGMPAAPPAMAKSKNRIIRMAQNKLDDVELDDLKKELGSEYGIKACSALEKKHPQITWIAASDGVELIMDGSPVLILEVGSDLFLEDIKPVGEFQKLYPYNSLKFYQSYWKPIVEEIGHCCVGDNSCVLHLSNKCLPDIPKKCPYESSSYQTVSKDSKMPLDVSVSFKGDPASWFIKECKFEKIASAKYSKEEYYQNGKGAIVVCIEPSLKSYFQQTGQVVQVIPYDDHLEVDVNFGHSMFRMIESQFDILNDL